MIEKKKVSKIRHLAIAIITTLLISSNAYSEEVSVKQYNTRLGGNFNVKTWLGTNSVDQFITITGSNAGSSFINSKQSMTMVEVDSNYWFGFITQNQLSAFGPLFGIGLDFAYGKNSFDNLSLASSQGLTADIVTYMIDLSFLKLALLSDEKLSKYIALSGHYISYSNTLSGSSPLNGLGIGFDSQYSFADTADVSFKLNYVPSASSLRLSNAWGATGELGLKWFVSPKAAINVSYKASYFTGRAAGQTTAQDASGKATPVSFAINLQDILHGLNIGGSYYF